MTKILILEDNIECLSAIVAMVERVSDRVSAVPVNSLEEARRGPCLHQEPTLNSSVCLFLFIADGFSMQGDLGGFPEPS